jgi:hypothetical protein
MIHEEICTYEVCKLAKDNGFNCKVYNYYQATKHYYETLRGIELHSVCWKLETDDCYSRYNKGSEDIVSAPTQSLLQRWLREEKGYYVYPFFDNESRRWTWVCRELTGDKWIQLLDFEERYFDSYELALEDALKYALENLV